MFCRYVLRTTDPVAARAFYADALSISLPNGAVAGTSLEAWPLHERARALGAPSHWLGHLEVDDLDGVLARLLELGSEPLGPTVLAQDGVRFATVRDPFGTVIALRERWPSPADHLVVWHQLHTTDLERAWSMYEELFGWVVTGTLDEPGLEGGYRLFAFDAEGETVGAMGNTARRPGVHPHWLFCFGVADLAGCIARVTALGGDAMEPFNLPDGTKLVGCHDPQGAAFGLAQSSAALQATANEGSVDAKLRATRA